MTDIRWWTGWTARQANAALAALDVAEVAPRRRRHRVRPGRRRRSRCARPKRGWRSCPGLDPTTMGWKERDWYLGDHGAALFDRNGNAGPTIVGRRPGDRRLGADGGRRRSRPSCSSAVDRATERRVQPNAIGSPRGSATCGSCLGSALPSRRSSRRRRGVPHLRDQQQRADEEPDRPDERAEVRDGDVRDLAGLGVDVGGERRDQERDRARRGSSRRSTTTRRASARRTTRGTPRTTPASSRP